MKSSIGMARTAFVLVAAIAGVAAYGRPASAQAAQKIALGDRGAHARIAIGRQPRVRIIGCLAAHVLAAAILPKRDRRLEVVCSDRAEVVTRHGLGGALRGASCAFARLADVRRHRLHLRGCLASAFFLGHGFPLRTVALEA